MTQVILSLCLAVASLPNRGTEVYHIRPLSEKELTATYESILRDSWHHAQREWHETPEHPLQGWWGSGVSDGNEGIRAISHMVLASGALAKYAKVPKAERQQYLGKALRAIRYAVSTHVTGSEKCTDRKHWGGSWQSAMWTAELGFGAWLMWDYLSPEDRQGIERVVAWECDRFLTTKPPAQRWADTKAEENGWTAPCLAVGANMFPSHPHAHAWHSKAIEYMMNTLSVPRDAKDATIVDCLPVKEWVTGANLHPDFTLENHGFFHPSYVQCSCYFLTNAAMCYVYAHRQVPQAVDFHLTDTWQMFQHLLTPWGETVFPQGMDWELHGLPAINLFAALACRKHDPLAAEMENHILQYIRTWQEWQGGDLAVPGSSLGFTRHAIQAGQVAYAYLAHKLFGPTAVTNEMKARKQKLPECVRHFSFVDVLLRRTVSKIFTFSWKYRIMGMVVPASPANLGNPFFSVPVESGLIGSFETTGPASIEVTEHSWRRIPGGVETCGTVLMNGGKLKQSIRIASIGEKTVVYADRVTAECDVLVNRELGVPLGIENDQISGGTRRVYHEAGCTAFEWRKAGQTAEIPGTFANVDSRLGVVAVQGAGLRYVQASGYNRQGVCADVLYGSFCDQPRHFKAGEEVARRIVLLYTEVTPEETRALAKSAVVKDTPHGRVLQFALPEGGKYELSL